jgi:hypothetical protein
MSPMTNITVTLSGKELFNPLVVSGTLEKVLKFLYDFFDYKDLESLKGLGYTKTKVVYGDANEYLSDGLTLEEYKDIAKILGYKMTVE